MGVCLLTFCLPDVVSDKDEETACYHAYKVFMLVASISFFLLTFMIDFIFQKFQMNTTIQVDKFELTVWSSEIAVFSSLYIYQYVLKRIYKDICEDSGTAVGMVAILPIYTLSLISMCVGIVLLLMFVGSVVRDCYMRRVCCHYRDAKLIS